MESLNIVLTLWGKKVKSSPLNYVHQQNNLIYSGTILIISNKLKWKHTIRFQEIFSGKQVRVDISNSVQNLRSK